MTEVESTPMLLLGTIAVEAGLVAQTREVFSVCVDETLDYRKVEPVRRAAKARGVELQRVGRAALVERFGERVAASGGVVAEVGPRRFCSLDDILTYSGDERCFIVMLDGVEDPFNFGQAIRSLYAAGCHGIVVRPRNWLSPDTPTPQGQLPAAAVVARASAGTSEFMPIAIADSPEEAAEFYKAKGLKILTAAEKDQPTPLYDCDLTRPTFLVVGGEKRGIKRAMLDRADEVIEVPYGRAFEHSLGTVAAVSVIAFELMRQRHA